MKRIILFCLLLSFSIASFTQVKLGSSFSESELILHTSSGHIYGTLTIPTSATESSIVIIVPGSGPTDRNCNSLVGLQTNAYKMLSEGLANNGISTLRFDKRGVGQSKDALKNQSELRFETYITDVQDWITLIQKDQRFSEIFILGHSEGALIGMIAVNQTNIAGYISISGVAKSADIVLGEQLRTKLPPPLLSESNTILDSLRLGKTASNINPNLSSIFEPSVQPYLISWMKYDPIKEFGRMTIPALIIQGTTDLQVTVDNAKLLSKAKTDAKLAIIDNMNHVLKDSNSDIQQNMKTYSNPELPLKMNLIYEIVTFIKSN